MAGESAVPGAITALITLLQGWPALAGIDVRDALSPPDESTDQAVMVGWQDPTGVASANAVDTAADVTAIFADMGSRDRETFSVHCAAMFLDGNSDYGEARAGAYALANAARAAVGANRDLGGTLQGRAIVGTGSLRYELVPDIGIKALVMFDVVCDAFTNP